MDAGVSPFCLPLKYTVETIQDEKIPPINRLKVTNKDGSLLMLFDVFELKPEICLPIVNPDKNSDQPDLFVATFIGASEEGMEDITVTHDRIGGKIAAIVTGKARIGTRLYPTIKAVWGPRDGIPGMIKGELIAVSSFFSLMTTAKFLDNLKFEVKPQ